MLAFSSHPYLNDWYASTYSTELNLPLAQMKELSSTEAAEALLSLVGLRSNLLSRLKWRGNADSAINSSFRLGTATQVTSTSEPTHRVAAEISLQISIGLSGLAAAELYRLRTGLVQDIVVDARHAILQSRTHHPLNWLLEYDLTCVGIGR